MPSVSSPSTSAPLLADLRIICLFLSLGLFGLACVSSGDAAKQTSESVAVSESSNSSVVSDFSIEDFFGELTVESMLLNGKAVPIIGKPVLRIDPVAMSAALDTGCNTHLGSYSFFANGQLTFTLTGGTQASCDAKASVQDSLLRSALGDVATWQQFKQPELQQQPVRELRNWLQLTTSSGATLRLAP